MSAYIVAKVHAAYLAAMAMTGSGLSYGGGLEWYFGKNGNGSIPQDDLVMAAAAANMIWKENMVSVAYRYGDPVDELPGDRFIENSIMKADIALAANIPFVAVQVLKACNCLEYQSCEHPGWETSEAHAFIQALKDKAIRALPGYEAATWGIPSTAMEPATGR